MKTLCVVTAVLSLASFGHSALAPCQTLTKPIEQRPDVSGTWYFVALSSSHCVFTTLINSLLSVSYKVAFTPTETANLYECVYDIKVNELCANTTSRNIIQGNKFYSADRNGVPEGKPEVILQTGCRDCVVIYINNYDHGFPYLMLLSRRPTVSEAELTEFNTQAKCLGWAKPIVYSTDHDYGNCQGFDEDSTVNFFRLSPVMIQRLTRNYQGILECISDSFNSYTSLLLNVVKQLSGSL